MCGGNRAGPGGKAGQLWDSGNEWYERFQTAYTTCGLQNVSVMNYLKSCLSAHFGTEPTLLS
jgi:hypothetical protein